MSMNIPESVEVSPNTLIDVTIHNGESLIETKVIGCPFSDNHFVIATLDFYPAKIIQSGN